LACLCRSAGWLRVNTINRASPAANAGAIAEMLIREVISAGQRNPT
jgi:hypothetical protein